MSFLIEGLREIKLAINNNWVIKHLLYCPSIIKEADLDNSFNNEIEKIEVSLEVYQKIENQLLVDPKKIAIEAIELWKRFKP